MRRLLNTIYVTTPDAYLALKGENVLIIKDDETIGRVPLHNLEAICTFGHQGASPALMAACVEQNIAIVFLTSNGRFRARVIGPSNGNVVLRKTQYRISDDEQKSAHIARHFLVGKLYNAKWTLERMTRDHALRIDVEKFKRVSAHLTESMKQLMTIDDLEVLRGVEGNAASAYFSLLDDMILQQKQDFFFKGRNRRPPLDNVNALLSFAYSLLSTEVGAALEGVGLDAYVGFLHRDRPGRMSLALDMMEELRSVYADRFVLSLINLKQVQASDFLKKESGAVLMTDDARKKILQLWKDKKEEKITHPFLKEKISWGLVPHAQALLLARFIRGDIDAYPPFLWK
ncbi:type I-C CRISPR-associated endonuclease Cas1c [Paenibacillus crassostreae]|uniref:CRISPR-associated endonuclease Cas1 n=1 Tax=Paenibacillus crassostreae TaxID=1763538 RepID=A0A162RLT1_9BACL|nr:type I-C CRISPR-associated endonuclease Cas1c [Paenibacillus crassostreae]AOZ91808.1 subtype I-C CRISPR-associated endonuclease Cas1 [Paenibacillus crassostreae]OAB73087.1 type I-C CRISPR-associated endonuclease Cas1 [Paenibacillus crassostreae]